MDDRGETTAGGTTESGTRNGSEAVLDRLFRNSSTNAVLAWAVVGVLTLVFVESLLDFDRQWILFVLVAGVVALLPPTAYGEWRVMLPWELLVVATLPILTRGLFGGRVGIFAAYVAVAGLALLVTVELHMFTALEVTHWFAVTFVVLTTMATAAAWSVVRWHLDREFGTAYLSTNDVLMVEFVWVTLAGFAAGVLFDAYFRRRDRQLRRAIGRVVGR